MKKYIITVSVLSALLLCSCGDIQSDLTNDIQEEEVSQKNEAEKIRHEAQAEVDEDGFYKVNEYLYDLDYDGEEDRIELFTTAHVENGEVHEDDGQNWRVTVTTADGIFKIFDEYIQLGKVELDIGEFYNDEPEGVIIMTLTTGAGKSIRHYTFSDGAFYEQQVYTTESFSEGGANIVTSMK